MTTQPQIGVGLSRQSETEVAQTADTASRRAKEFDPSTWQIPTGIAGLIYHVKRSFSKDLRAKHRDHLLYLDWEQAVAAAQGIHERVCAELQQALELRNIEARRVHRQEYVRQMMNRGVLPSVVFANWKSGSKTTLAAYVGTIMSDLAGRSSLLLPSTSNSKTASSGKITGLTGDHLTLLEFERDLDKFTSPRQLARRLAHTKQGLAVIVEDTRGDITQRRFAPERYEPVLRRAYGLTEAALLLDLGNDDFNEDEIPLKATRAADVIVAVATNTQPISNSTMQESLETLKTDPYDGQVEHMDERLPGEYRPTADKVKHALIVISGVKPTDDPYDFDALRTMGAHNISERAPVTWQGEGFTVPFDAYVHGGHNQLTDVDLTAIDPATYDAYLDVTIAILEEGARALGISLDGLPEFTPEEFIAPAMEEIPQPDYESVRSS